MRPGSLPVLKKIKPKIKIRNLNNHNLENKEELKEKILKKNAELNDCLERDNESIFGVLFLAKNQNGHLIMQLLKYPQILEALF